MTKLNDMNQTSLEETMRAVVQTCRRVFPKALKTAVIKSFFKKARLINNCGPILNLPFISQKIKKVVFQQLPSLSWLLWQPLIRILTPFTALPWLPVRQRIDFKILLPIYKSLRGPGQKYITEMLLQYKPSRAQRSSGAGLLTLQSGEAAFSNRAGRTKLPEKLTCSNTDCFKSKLKMPLPDAELQTFNF